MKLIKDIEDRYWSPGGDIGIHGEIIQALVGSLPEQLDIYSAKERKRGWKKGSYKRADYHGATYAISFDGSAPVRMQPCWRRSLVDDGILNDDQSISGSFYVHFIC